jgi:hypothetical protein
MSTNTTTNCTAGGQREFGPLGLTGPVGLFALGPLVPPCPSEPRSSAISAILRTLRLESQPQPTALNVPHPCIRSVLL